MGKKYGKWERGNEVGSGGQGHVYYCWPADAPASDDTATAVIKVLSAERKGRATDEVAALQTLSGTSEHIIKIIDADLDAKDPFIVMECCRGKTFKHLPLETLDRATVLSLFAELVEAVAVVHSAGFVHRDLKPENVLLRTKDGPVVLADFGLVFLDEEDRKTAVNEGVGPRGFIAPELEGARFDDVGTAADVYSLGRLLYWLLAPRMVFQREKFRDARWDLSTLKDPRDHFWHYLNDFLDRCVVEEPTKRIQNASALLPEVKSLVEKEKTDPRFLSAAKAVVQPCIFCRSGTYRRRARRTHGGLAVGSGSGVFHGLGRSGDSALMIWTCDRCGHVAEFDLDLGVQQAWKLEGDV